MANDMFSRIGVAGDSAFFTRSDEGSFLSVTSALHFDTQRMPQARYSLMSTGPALLNPRVGTRESARVGGRHLDSPSTTVRLGHLAGIYNCLDSKSHRPFVLEFSLRPGSQCPPLRDLSSPSRTSPRPTGEIIPQVAEVGKRGLRLVSHFSGSRTRAETIGFARPVWAAFDRRRTAHILHAETIGFARPVWAGLHHG